MGGEQSQPLTPEGMNLNQALTELSALLVPSDQYYHGAGVAANELFDILRKYRDDVDRVIVAGSIGKRTAISTIDIPGAAPCKPPDVDVVVFLNGKSPPYTSVIQEFIKAFERAERDGHEVRVKNGRDTHYVCVEFRGYSFDVAPAPNLRKKHWFSETSHRSAVMDLISKSPNKYKACRAYGSALAEDAVDFMRRQSHAHALIRLAKFWNSQVKTSGYVFARSYLIECVAIHAYREGLTKGLNLLEMFKSFLYSMSYFDGLRVDLERDKFPEYESGLKTSQEFWGLRESAHIVDPVNEYNNLGVQDCEVYSLFRDAGHQTYWKLECRTKQEVSSWRELMWLIQPNDIYSGYDGVDRPALPLGSPQGESDSPIEMFGRMCIEALFKLAIAPPPPETRRVEQTQELNDKTEKTKKKKKKSKKNKTANPQV